VALAVVVLAGCGQPATSAPDVFETVSVPIQPTITPIAPITTGPETLDPRAPAAEGEFDASDHLKTTSCAATGGVWSYAGTLTNPQATQLTYTVAITLVRSSDMSEVVTKEVQVTVPAGGTARVEAKAFHTDAAKDLQCLTGVTVKEN
jgi:hypothetical protein